MNHQQQMSYVALPETGFIGKKQVLALVPFSYSTLWRKMKAGLFPKSVQLSARIPAWRVEDIRQWIFEQGQEEQAEKEKPCGAANTDTANSD